MLTDLQNAILTQLRPGKAHAIPGHVLAKRLGHNNDRTIREEIRDLIASGFAIASSNSKPMGFYLAESPEEVEEYMAVLQGRLVEDAYRRRDFKRAARDIMKPQQLALL